MGRGIGSLVLVSFAGIATVASAGVTGPITPSLLAAVVGTSTAKPSSRSGSVPMSRLVATFSGLAGSTANAQSLVEGLRTGTMIALVDSSNVTTTFSPATKAMGWGNVKIALALAQAELANAGIANPTPGDIEAALNGGTVVSGTTTTTLTGVLAQRASGLGWGQIADAENLNLGKIVSGVSKPGSAGNAHVSASTHRSLGQGIVSAGGSAGAAITHPAKPSTGMVTALGEPFGTTQAANGRAPARALAGGQGEPTVSGITTASGSGSGGVASHGHGKGQGGG